MRLRSLALPVCCAIALAAPAPSAAEDPPYVEVASYLPPLAGTYEPSSEDDCTSGKPRCVDKVIKEMYRRFDPQARTCDHAAIFALTYLRTTEEYQRASLTPGFFEDPYFVNHEDAVFARFYFDAYDDWKASRRHLVSEAWRIALDAGAEKRVSTTGNVLLGVNAHINRDLPYVLAGIGLVKPDGSSRKTDHDRVNQFLNRVSDTLYPELARRFDPSVDDGNLPGYLDDMASFQAFPAMREAAWRNAEALVNASTPAARAAAEAEIENSAANTANAIVAATSYGPLSEGSGPRDAYCAAHHND